MLTQLGLSAWAVPQAPVVRTHDVDVPRIGYVHSWTRTQDEGWVRAALDTYGVPYTYFADQKLKDGNLRAKYDVILFGPGGGSSQSIINGMPMWRGPIPWKNSPDTPNIGTYAQTDDMRPGLGLQGLMNLQNFVKQGGVYVGAVGSATFALENGMTHGVSMNTPGTATRVVGSLLRTQLVDDALSLIHISEPTRPY